MIELYQNYQGSSYSPTLNFGNCSEVVCADIVFGIQSRDCAGNGICRMYPQRTIGIERNYIHYALAQFFWDAHGCLLIAFGRDSMRLSTLRKFFFSGWFLLEESIQLADFICWTWQRDKIVIREGIFKVTATKNKYIIKITPEYLMLDGVQ